MVVDWTGVGLGKLYGGVDRKVRTDGLSGGRIDAKESRMMEDDIESTFWLFTEVGVASLDDDDDDDDSKGESLLRFRFFGLSSSRCFSIINPPPTEADVNDVGDTLSLITDFNFVFIFDFIVASLPSSETI